MKNQYLCDIGDYGKYALMRAFATADVKVGVNWYLTEDDGSKDGKFVDYLEKGDLRWLCPDLFDELTKIVNKKNRTIQDIEKSGILPGAGYFSEQIPLGGTPDERLQKRVRWFEKSLEALADAELIFADPDNGLLVSDNAKEKDSEKYILPAEVERMFRDGYNVVYYCHKGRRQYKAWVEYLSMMFERIDDAKPAVLTYHKGTQRSYVFLIHKKDFQKYRGIIDTFHSRWYRLFSEEYTEIGDVTREVTEAPFVVKCSDGAEVTIEKRADGKIQIKNSKNPATYLVLDADQFCRRVWMY